MLKKVVCEYYLLWWYEHFIEPTSGSTIVNPKLGIRYEEQKFHFGCGLLNFIMTYKNKYLFSGYQKVFLFLIENSK